MTKALVQWPAGGKCGSPVRIARLAPLGAMGQPRRLFPRPCQGPWQKPKAGRWASLWWNSRYPTAPTDPAERASRGCFGLELPQSQGYA